MAYDVDRDGAVDYWQYQGADGRKRALAYGGDKGAHHERVVLDDVSAAECPHYLIVLDGIPFDVVEEMYARGHFRLFWPPRRVISCYPAMTDLALARLFDAGPCLAFQARRFDRERERVVSGNAAYLEAANSPWVQHIDYRCSFWWDTLVYLNPQAVFDHELAGFLKTFDAHPEGEARVYAVGTAGLATRRGRDGVAACLMQIEQLCERLVYERRGRVKITITADHGHNLAVNRRVKFGEALKQCGYRLAPALGGERDVVVISYGLVTYAELYTDDPAGVADCMVQHEAVEFACFVTDEGIVVRDRVGDALIRKLPAGFAYEVRSGDPLRLERIVGQLQAEGHVSEAGAIDGEALFEATSLHEYPAPLRRIWDAFHTLTETRPDVIVNLRDGTCHGSGFFHAMIGRVDSTHGSLNRLSSTTFVLTMLGELPPVMRGEDLLKELETLRVADVRD